jgi:glucose-1-phosphate cytidylyltransferase
MIAIGGRPILWHIMKIYAAYGHNEFIICLGYKGWMIKEYFINYYFHNADLTVDLKDNSCRDPQQLRRAFQGHAGRNRPRYHDRRPPERILPYTNGEPFMLTYGDGVSNVPLDKLIEHHKASGRICTMTAIQATSRFGVIKMEDDGNISSFEEKPADSGTWINGGFFVLQPEIANYLHEDADETMWERQPMDDLARAGEISAYRHHDFWKAMDTLAR